MKEKLIGNLEKEKIMQESNDPAKIMQENNDPGWVIVES